MKAKLLIVGMLGVTSVWGQRITDRRSAEIRGGGGEGKCTIEVLVDDVAEVEILGRNAVIRTINGGPSSFRRFQCNQEMPNRPYDFRFEGIDGRGRQGLVRPPENGRPAIIRIEDSKGGNEGYTFDIFWRGGDGYGGGGFGGGRNNRGGGFGGGGGGRWNDGWGQGDGWTHGSVSYSGGGGGFFRDRNGNNGQINGARVNIGSDGQVNLEFDTTNGRKFLSGRVENRNNRRVFARVNGSNMRGLIEIEMNSREEVRRIRLDEGRNGGELNWSN